VLDIEDGGLLRVHVAELRRVGWHPVEERGERAGSGRKEDGSELNSSLSSASAVIRLVLAGGHSQEEECVKSEAMDVGRDCARPFRASEKEGCMALGDERDEGKKRSFREGGKTSELVTSRLLQRAETMKAICALIQVRASGQVITCSEADQSPLSLLARLLFLRQLRLDFRRRLRPSAPGFSLST
jgi:hypothetical protein